MQTAVRRRLDDDDGEVRRVAFLVSVLGRLELAEETAGALKECPAFLGGALLRPEFGGLQGIAGAADHPLRQQLARHFVQRRRKDIEEWLRHVEGTDHPKDLVDQWTTTLEALKVFR